MSVSKEQWLAEMTENFGVDPEDVLEVAAMFFEAIDGRLAGIAKAHEEGDMKELNRLAHGLKGDAANMSFPEVSKLARELEAQSKNGEVVDFDAQFQALSTAVGQKKEFLGLE